MNFLYFFLCLIGGVAIEIYTFQLVRLFGHQDWAEKYLGSGGTYLMWKLMGIFVILTGFYVLRHNI